MPERNLGIVIPVYNDWDSLIVLIPEIDRALKSDKVKITFFIVNDASSDEITLDSGIFHSLERTKSIHIVHLNCNMGHQRAIAIGLSSIAEEKSLDSIVVMDADGEDRPEDISLLIKEHLLNKSKVVVAHRAKRSEGMLFKTGYLIYKIMFAVLTGKRIAFGNFCLIPFGLLNRLIYRDSLWNHLPATILKSKLPISIVPTIRGNRIKGKAKMNFSELVLLGLSAVSVYSDVALLRTFSLSAIFGVVTITGIIIVTIIRLFTDLATPGWASTVVGSLTVILVLSLVMSILGLFTILASRSHLAIVPAKHLADFIDRIESISKKKVD